MMVQASKQHWLSNQMRGFVKSQKTTIEMLTKMNNSLKNNDKYPKKYRLFEESDSKRLVIATNNLSLKWIAEVYPLTGDRVAEAERRTGFSVGGEGERDF